MCLCGAGITFFFKNEKTKPKAEMFFFRGESSYILEEKQVVGLEKKLDFCAFN